jgi:hypothetical protein
MPEDPARKAFEASARTTREAVDRGNRCSGAGDQTGRAKLRIYSGRHSHIADGIRGFNAKLLDIAPANTMAGRYLVGGQERLCRQKQPSNLADSRQAVSLIMR